MNDYTLNEVTATDFDNLTISEIRARVESAIHDLKTTIWDRDEEIDDWAAGGWRGRQTMMRRYGNLEQAEDWQVMAVAAFDKLIHQFERREREELQKALSNKKAA